MREENISYQNNIFTSQERIRLTERYNTIITFLYYLLLKFAPAALVTPIVYFMAPERFFFFVLIIGSVFGFYFVLVIIRILFSWNLISFSEEGIIYSTLKKRKLIAWSEITSFSMEYSKTIVKGYENKKRKNWKRKFFFRITLINGSTEEITIKIYPRVHYKIKKTEIDSEMTAFITSILNSLTAPTSDRIVQFIDDLNEKKEYIWNNS